MTNYGLVSIITPSYNSAPFIAETIKSVLAQTYTHWEMIIVDDCSSDTSCNLIEEYANKDSRIKLLKLERNSGAAVARNKAMEFAQGRYMAFLDSDDLWMSDKLERQLNYMRLHDYAFTCTSYTKIDENGNSLNYIVKTLPRINYNRILLDCPVGNSTVMYDVNKMGKFEVPNIRKRNDDALWLQMLRKEKYLYGMSDVLMKYRLRRNSISSNKFSLIKYHWYLYRHIEHLSLLRSLFHIGYWGIIKVFHLK